MSRAIIRHAVFLFACVLLMPQTASAGQCVDSDGDGYGWDGVVTCIPDTAVAGVCLDDDGDGYGWNGVETCLLDQNATQPVALPPQQSTALCIDSDGDGFGWNGFETCVLEDQSANPSMVMQCRDDDGDGYGWNGQTTCVPDVAEPVVQCIDSDGDGYGWNGLTSCIPDDQPDPNPVSPGSVVGIVDLNTSREPVFGGSAEIEMVVDGYAAFHYRSGIDDYIDFLLMPGNDYCSVEGGFEDDIVFSTHPGMEPEDGDFASISAGDEVVISNSSGFREVMTEDDFYAFEYNYNGQISSWPDGLMVTIPGSTEVAGFSSESIPDVREITGINLRVEDSASSSPLLWDAGSNPDHKLLVDYTAVGDAESYYVNCILSDDGMFDLPQAMANLLQGRRVENLYFGRLAWRVVEKDNTALYLFNQRSTYSY